eukprot:1145181-Prorocentrum_lima.AAC.1
MYSPPPAAPAASAKGRAGLGVEGSPGRRSSCTGSPGGGGGGATEEALCICDAPTTVAED